MSQQNKTFGETLAEQGRARLGMPTEEERAARNSVPIQMAHARDQDLLDYARRAAPYGNVPRWIPPGTRGALPIKPPGPGSVPAFNKGGKVLSSSCTYGGSGGKHR